MTDLIFHLFLDLAEVYAIVTIGCAPVFVYRRFALREAMPRRPRTNVAAPSSIETR
jgi:hypothetical protein